MKTTLFNRWEPAGERQRGVKEAGIAARLALWLIPVMLQVLPGSAQADNLFYNASGQLQSMTASGTLAAPSIVTPPPSSTLEVGQTLSLAVNATGSGLSYQWYKGENAIQGATQATLIFNPASAGDAGSYTVTVSNASGSVTSDPAVLSLPVNPFTEPLGGVGEGWVTGGSTVWHVITDPTQTHDGVDAVGTGHAFDDDSYLEGTLTVTQPTTVRFWMKMPGFYDPEETLTHSPCAVDVIVNGRTSYTVQQTDDIGVWKQYFIHLYQAGTYTLRWHHSANGYVLLDDLSTSAAPDTDMDGLSDDWEMEFFGDLTPLPTADPDYDVNSNLVEYHDRTLPNDRSSYLIHVMANVHGGGHVTLSPPEPVNGYDSAGDYTLTLTPVPDAGQAFTGWQGSLTNSSNLTPLSVSFSGWMRTQIFDVWFDAISPIGDAVDEPALTWTTGGDAPWVTETRTTSDGVDALMSGTMPQSADAKTSWVETTVTGPVKLSYDYLFQSSATTASFVLTMDGLDVRTYYGAYQWATEGLYIPAGTHTLRWTHTQLGTQQVYRWAISYLDKVSTTSTTDSDHDGMADEWEMQLFGTLSRDGTGDYDSDGVNDLTEYNQLSDPTSYYDHRSLLTITTTGSGTVNVSPQMSSYTNGDVVQITAVPAPGWELQSWSGMSVATSNPFSFTFYTPNIQNANVPLTANFVPSGQLNEALDNATLVFDNGLPDGWVKTTAVSHDGVDSAQSPANGNYTSAVFSTTVNGPSVAAFWWKLDLKNVQYSTLTFTDNNTQHVSTATGDNTWQRVVVQLPEAGAHLLKWSFGRLDYSFDPSAAWVDQLVSGPDVDQDGIADDWEVTNFGAITATTGADDPDHDGNTNQIEWADGTDPNSAASALYRLALVKDGPASVIVSPVQESYPAGAQLTLTADPAFTGWSGDVTGTTNPLTLTMNSNKALTANFQAVASGVDNTKYVFANDPVHPWDRFVQAGYGYNDNDVATAAVDLTETQESYVETTFTASGRVTFTAISQFYGANGGNFRWLVDGVEAGRYSGYDYSSQNETLYLTAGTHTVRWIYKQGTVDAGSMYTAYLDNLVFTPMEVIPLDVALDGTGVTWGNGSSGIQTWLGRSTTTHDGVDAAETLPTADYSQSTLEATINPAVESVVSFWWKVSSEEYFDYLTFASDGEQVTRISGEQDWARITLTVPAGPHTLSWIYSKDSSGAAGQDRAWLDQFTVQPIQSFPLVDALDNPALTWTTSSGGTAWTGTNSAAYDGVDSAVNGTITSGGTSWIQTQVTGPGTLSFWWKISTDPNATLLYLQVDGNYTQVISGETDWTQVTMSLGAGTHTLRWSYFKNDDPVEGQDKAWLDQVVFTTTTPGFGTWASGYGLSGMNAQPTATPMNDNISNLLKYAFNLAPNVSVQGAARYVNPGVSTSGLPSIRTMSQSGVQKLQVEYVRRRNSPDITYTVQFGSDLTPDAWSAATATETVTTIDANWERVVVQDTVTSSTTSRRFGRVQVTQNP